ncbi:MAG: type II secretion system F family protein [Planctomycetota bacterium]|nr:MAG: type II secretion system F family protein [Planctomycetota bacterium]
MTLRFAYKAVAAQGGAQRRGFVQGVEEAVSVEALRRQLRSRGLVVVQAKPAGKGVAGTWRRGQGRLRAAERLWFFQTLAQLLEGATPLEEALATMQELAPSPRARSACEAVRQRLRSGESLAQAVEAIEGLAPPQQAALLRVGAATGDVARAARLAAEGLVRRRELAQAAWAKLTYPAIVLTAALGAVWFLSVFVVPRISQTLRSLGAELPWMTRATLGVAQAAVWGAPALAALVVAAVVAWRRGWAPPRLRAWLGRRLLEAPVLRDMLWAGQAALACDTIASTVAGGGDVLEGLRLAGQSLGLEALQRRFHEALTLVREGMDVAEALRRTRALPPLVEAVVRTGVRSGDLEGAFARASRVAAQRQREATERFVTFLEPATILALAAVVGWVIYSLVAGMLTIYDLGGV